MTGSYVAVVERDGAGRGQGVQRWRPRLAAWRPGVAAVPAPRPSPWLHALLRERGSLTARLERIGPVHVQVLRQCRARPAREEAVALGLPVGRHAWLREVILACEGGPWVFARSLVPQGAPGPLGRLTRLGARPLGRLLFSAPDVARGPLAVARLDGDEPLSCWLEGYGLGPVRGAWARRSALAARGQQILVTEVFFPWATAHKEAFDGERRGA